MKFGGPDLIVTYDGKDVTQHIQGDINIDIENVFSDSKPFGQNENESIPTGDQNIPDFGWGGQYDDIADGPKRLWDPTYTGFLTPSTSPKSLVLTMGTPSGSPADSYTIPVFVKKFTAKGSRNKVHDYAVMFTKGPGTITRA